jgi:hypothetical protein
MHGFSNTAAQRYFAGTAAYSLTRNGPGEETQEEEEGLELPVNPDQGIPLIPDEQGDIAIPA